METNSINVFSWTALLVCALTGLGFNFLFNLLSLAVGPSLFSEQSKHLITFSLMSFVGFIVVAIISMFMTGWVAGALSKNTILPKKWGILYGFIAWSLSFIFTVFLLTNMMQFTQFHSNFTSNNLVAVRITNQMPMSTETKSANAELDNRTITLNAYVTFVLFLVGALSSCIGGYSGYTPRAEKDN